MNPITKAYWTAKGVGWDNLPRRILQAWRVCSGSLRHRLDPVLFSDAAFHSRTGLGEAADSPVWSERFRSSCDRFLRKLQKNCLLNVSWEESTIERMLFVPCEKALSGEYLYFGRLSRRLGWPPQFNVDPRNAIRYPVGEHCQAIARSGPPGDDVKLAWEPSRLSMAYYFARAYIRTSDARWADAFWRLFDAWVEQNPVQLSVAWGCSQETTFRMMAVLFAAAMTIDSEAATSHRLFNVQRLVWQAASSIVANLNYGLSQKNNHGISEAMGLWTAGLLFPDWPEARLWRELGRHFLIGEVRRQVYDDGSYVQHSTNYHRVMLDDLLWAIRLGQLNGDPLPNSVMDRFEKATNWLAEMVDRQSGRVPNYGPNDGAQVLPLSCCDYLDYRPVLQACWYLIHGARFFEPGPWDEKMLWLFGEDSLGAAVRASRQDPSFSAPNGGYYVLRGPHSSCMTRCHTYRDRPAEPDMLHVDLWHAGENIARDAGSYHYYTTDPVGPFFRSTAAHNTVEVDSTDQMCKGPRFLWYRWTKSRVLANRTFAEGRAGFFKGEHYGYRRLRNRVTHCRSILRVDDVYLVVDDLTGEGRHDVALRWRLAPGTTQIQGQGRFSRFSVVDYNVAVFRPDGAAVRLLAGQETHPYVGWESLYYGERQAVPTVCMHWSGCLPLTCVTLFGGSLEVAPFLGALDSIVSLKPLRLPPALPDLLAVPTDEWAETTDNRFQTSEGK